MLTRRSLILGASALPVTGALRLGICAPAHACPTGVLIHDPAKAYPGYLLFGAPDGHTHLVDMAGRQAHEWQAVGFPSQMLAPALTGGRKGHLLVNFRDSHEEAAPIPAASGSLFGERTIGEVDWSGHDVWRWRLPENARQHHACERLPNGNTMLLAAVTRKIEEFPLPLSDDQGLYEVTPEGRTVWTWFAGDHLADLGLSKRDLAVWRTRGPGGSGFLGLNGAATLGSNRWFASGDQRFHPDNVVITSRNTNIIAIVDRRSGRVVWRLGPDYAENGSKIPRPVDQISAGQAACMIPEGRPGAGNMLLFDDQGPSGISPVALDIFGGSRVIEIDPVSKEIVWQYSAESSGRPAYAMHAFYGGNAERLPNGCTLINAAFFGHVLQVTPGGEIVWEYLSPYVSSGRMKDAFLNAVQFVPSDWIPNVRDR